MYSLELENERVRETNVWTYDEFNRFIEFVDGEEYKALFITLFNTGMRLGEALALCWNDLKNFVVCDIVTKRHRVDCIRSVKPQKRCTARL